MYGVLTPHNHRLPPDWRSRRRLVYQRDNYQCQKCGTRGGPNGNAELHAHHIIPKSSGGSHHYSNLTTLCSRCHSAHHGYPIGSQTLHGTPNPVPKDQQIPKWGTWKMHVVLFFIGALMGGPGIVNLMYITVMWLGHWVQKVTYDPVS